MERRDENETALRNRSERGETKEPEKNEYAADAAGGRAGTGREEDESSGLLGSSENLDTE